MCVYLLVCKLASRFLPQMCPREAPWVLGTILLSPRQTPAPRAPGTALILLVPSCALWSSGFQCPGGKLTPAWCFFHVMDLFFTSEGFEIFLFFVSCRIFLTFPAGSSLPGAPCVCGLISLLLPD